MRRRPQPDELRREADEPVVAIGGDVIERDVNRQAPAPRGWATNDVIMPFALRASRP